MKIEKDISIKSFNTFRVDVKASTVVTLENDSEYFSQEIKDILLKEKYLILGECSNTLFTKDYTGTILLTRNKGIQVVEESIENSLVYVSSGTHWNDFVGWSIENGLEGLQNLIDIPGTVGASPVQNIGAYGVEVKDFIDSVRILNTKDFKEYILTNKECNFGYRESIFKKELKDSALIVGVTFLLKKYKGKVDEKYLQYAGLQEKLETGEITLKRVLEAVREIRKEKLPSTDLYGSCGSTFKNLEIKIDKYKELESKFPNLPKFETPNPDIVKVPTAYILEKLGWKNKRDGDVGTWIHHPLIVTNYGDASASEIFSFIQSMQKDFKKNTGLNLETEININ